MGPPADPVESIQKPPASVDVAIVGAVGSRQPIAPFRTYFRCSKGVAVEQQWAGMIDATPEAIPVISTVRSHPGLVIATGLSGNGFGIGPGAGRLAADLVSGTAPLVDPQACRYERFIDGTKPRPTTGV